MLQLDELNDALDEIEIEPRRQESKLLKLRKALESDYQKNILDIVDVEEVNLLKRYFNKIIHGSRGIVEIGQILDEYVEVSKDEPYSKVVETLKGDLTTQNISIDEFLDFIEKFVAQKYPIDIFYKKYFKRSPAPKPSLTDLFGDELSDLSSSEDEDGETTNDETEEEKLKRVKERIESKREEPKTAQEIEPQEQREQRERGKVAVISVPQVPPQVRTPEPKPVADKVFFQTMDDLTKKDCEFLYKKIPWVKDVINHIYVHPVEGEFEELLDFEAFVEYDGVRFYQPKENYYAIQCRSHKVQEGQVLTIIKNGQTYRLKVAIDTNTKGMVLQNEDMLKAEVDYIRVWNQNKNEQIRELRRNEPNDNMIFLAKFELSNALQDAISGSVNVDYKSSNSEFIDIVVQTIRKHSNSGDSFVRLLAGIVIFLKINISFVASSVFIKRLREQIYLPGTLPFLTDADKLPEIFLVKDVPTDTKEFVLKKLEEERLSFSKSFFESLYINSSMVRKPTRPVLWNKPTQQIELPDIKTICKNRTDIEHENDEDIVFYTDLSEVYCFNIYKLYGLFQKDETPANPYTGRPFSNDFIQLFLTQYASKPLVKKIERVQHTDLMSKLEQLIEQELSMLENNLLETENPDFVAKFKSSIAPKGEHDVREPKKRISRVVEKFDQNSKCAECKKELDSDKIRSVFRNREIFFCGYDCLEKNKSFK